MTRRSPAELIKCRLQLGATSPHHYHAGPLQCAQASTGNGSRRASLLC